MPRCSHHNGVQISQNSEPIFESIDQRQFELIRQEFPVSTCRRLATKALKNSTMVIVQDITTVSSTSLTCEDFTASGSKDGFLQCKSALATSENKTPLMKCR
mmetsp:Transcript_4436/g.13232  ORF Transcript_4436/g.13232 Transcript_4436/m.13232 type:complete len:102 (-) Transcript_4436:5789-6094(-)